MFLRYHTNEEHEALLSGLCVEQRIRHYISELQESRATGCHTLAEAEQFKAEKLREEANTRRVQDVSAPGPTGKELQHSNKISSKDGLDADTNISISYASTFDISELPGTNLLSATNRRKGCYT
ncbi:hypothetical protein KP509_1Z229000 [Ceratopteris richardii]|nr:hypothetical protein KP509_1Z229000 [Ceratopteris richardii]